MKKRKILKYLSILVVLIAVCLILIFAIPRRINFDEDTAKYIGATRTVKSLEDGDSGTIVKRDSTCYNIYAEASIKDIVQLLDLVTYKPAVVFEKLSTKKEKIELEIYASYDVVIFSLSIFPNSSYVIINGRTFKLIEGAELQIYHKLMEALEKYSEQYALDQP